MLLPVRTLFPHKAGRSRDPSLVVAADLVIDPVQVGRHPRVDGGLALLAARGGAPGHNADEPGHTALVLDQGAAAVASADAVGAVGAVPGAEVGVRQRARRPGGQRGHDGGVARLEVQQRHGHLVQVVGAREQTVADVAPARQGGDARGNVIGLEGEQGGVDGVAELEGDVRAHQGDVVGLDAARVQLVGDEALRLPDLRLGAVGGAQAVDARHHEHGHAGALVAVRRRHHPLRRDEGAAAEVLVQAPEDELVVPLQADLVGELGGRCQVAVDDAEAVALHGHTQGGPEQDGREEHCDHSHCGDGDCQRRRGARLKYRRGSSASRHAILAISIVRKLQKKNNNIVIASALIDSTISIASC